MKNKSIAIVILLSLLSLLFLGGSLSKITAVNSTKESNSETVADVEREIENKKIQIEDIKSKIEESVDVLLRDDIVLHDKIVSDDAKNVLNDFYEKRELEIESEIKLINLKASIIYDVGSTAAIYIAKQELLLYENYYDDLNEFLIQANNRIDA